MASLKLIAKRMAKVEASGIRKIFDLVQNMKDAVDLSLGQAHFDIPDPIKEAAYKAIREGHSKYTVTQGIPELHEKLRETLKRKYAYEPEGIVFTCGAAGGLFLSLMVLVDEGDEVLLPDPCFVLYKHIVNICGGIPRFIDTYPDFRLTPEKIEKQITPKTKLLLFNNPVNPTGVAYSAEEVSAIAATARKHKLLILSDEVYDNFSYDFPHASMAQHYDRTVLINAFSKTYAMPGWRIGYTTGPREIVDQMVTLQQFSYVCAPAPAQKTAAFALDVDMTPYIRDYRRKRDMISEELSPHFEMAKSQGAFYLFPRVPWGTDQEFVKTAIANNLLIVPGGAFSQKTTHFRISYAATDEKLRKGIEILKRLATRRES
ncbi:MAG: aspartate aminotransferase [Planctomycetes bacterium RBG_16_59_8]|nr:MAG: aspartate aminotransferase [Planctomycetes bacterium RBG_16_59_8]